MSKKLFQLKVQLQNYRPSIYRTFVLSENETFQTFHSYIQETFGFYDGHLRHFTKYDKRDQLFEIIPADEFRDDTEDTSISPDDIVLGDIFVKQGHKTIKYMYDFGDSRTFDITLQKVLEDDNKKYKKLVKCKGGMLIEDCGGVRGLQELVDDFQNNTFNEDLFESYEKFREHISLHLEEPKLSDFSLNS